MCEEPIKISSSNRWLDVRPPCQNEISLKSNSSITRSRTDPIALRLGLCQPPLVTVAPEEEQLAQQLPAGSPRIEGVNMTKNNKKSDKQFFSLAGIDWDDDASIDAWARAVWGVMDTQRKEEMNIKKSDEQEATINPEIH